MTYTERLGEFELWIDCEECDFEGLVYYNTKPPEYCSDKCRQRACRRRRREARNVTDRAVVSKTYHQEPNGAIADKIGPIPTVELKCECGRGLFAHPANVKIGQWILHCNMCDSEIRVR